MRTEFGRLFRVACAALVFACFAMLFVAAGASGATTEPSGRQLVVGTRVAPPFSMKNTDGVWEGISIDLWRHVAERLHLRYRIEERGSVQDLVDAVASGQVDVAVAALTVTAARRGVMDFSQPFFETGLGVAVPSSGITAWLPVLHTFASFRFLQAVLTLLSIALFVGALILNPAVAFDLRAGFAARHNHCERFRPAQVAAADQVDALSGSVSAPR
jgi:ABC-type amino acid transport substrate-binding protein